MTFQDVARIDETRPEHTPTLAVYIDRASETIPREWRRMLVAQRSPALTWGIDNSRNQIHLFPAARRAARIIEL
jgi:hypothetical protein